MPCFYDYFCAPVEEIGETELAQLPDEQPGLRCDATEAMMILKFLITDGPPQFVIDRGYVILDHNQTRLLMRSPDWYRGLQKDGFPIIYRYHTGS